MARPKKAPGAKDSVSESSSWIKALVEQIKVRREEIEFRRENQFCQECGDDSNYEVKTPADTRYVCMEHIVPYCCMINVHIIKLKD